MTSAVSVAWLRYSRLSLAATLPTRSSWLSVAADAVFFSGQGRGGDYDNRDLEGVRFAGSIRFANKRVGVFVGQASANLKFLLRPQGHSLRWPNWPVAPPWVSEMQGWST